MGIKLRRGDKREKERGGGVITGNLRHDIRYMLYSFGTYNKSTYSVFSCISQTMKLQ